MLELLSIGGALVAGFAVGMLVMRNNYKHFKRDEEELRKLIIDPRVSASAIVLKLRNKLGV